MYETLGGIVLDINEIKELVSQFDHSSLTEFDLREGQFELYMNKNASSRGMNAVVPKSTSSEIHRESEGVSQNQLQETATKEVIQEIQSTPETFEGMEVKSPIVGIIYLQPAPDKPQFKSIGDSVKKVKLFVLSKL